MGGDRLDERGRYSRIRSVEPLDFDDFRAVGEHCLFETERSLGDIHASGIAQNLCLICARLCLKASES